MALLHLEALPPRVTKGTILRLLIQLGEIDRQRIGTIELRGRAATVEVPDHWAPRLAKALDGADLANRHIRAWSESPASLGTGEDHFQRLLRLLEMEAQAETTRAAAALRKLSPVEAEQAGNSLIDLEVHEDYAGLGGHTLVTLVKRSRTPLPWTRLGVGSPVLLTGHESADPLRGVISERSRDSVQVALSRPVPDSHRSLPQRLDLSHDEIAGQRQRTALQRVRGARGDRLAGLRSVLLGEVPPSFHAVTERTQANEPTCAAQLNASQIAAVEFALSAHDVAMIHGPPGTGKTMAVAELIRQAVQRGEKVLACAPSNLAVDNLFERLLASNMNVVRLGHPARVLPELREHTLNLMVDGHDDIRLARKLTRQAHTLFEKAARFTRAKPAPGEKREMRGEAQQLLADARRLEGQVVQQILDSADVLCATLTGLDSEILGRRSFDLAVVDEACQTTEPACWIPLLRCDRLILAGDHCQLPPTVISRDAVAQGFGVSLFERLMALYGEDVSRQLTVQYRMHDAIMSFSSQRFYDCSLSAHDSVASHLLCDLPGVDKTDFTSQPIEFIDTAGAGYDEQLEPDGDSRLNQLEAELIARKAEALLAAGLPGGDLAMISPYAAQVRQLRELISVDGLEIDTVDGFQGREKEAILISLVRSNDQGDIGFLADIRRMNVALTRARRKLVVVGDSATIGGHAFYQQLLDYFDTCGAYRTVWEEPS